MFLCTISHVLVITDDFEIHDLDKPIPKHQLLRCIILCKNILYRACWILKIMKNCLEENIVDDDKKEGYLPVSKELREKITQSMKECDNRKKSEKYCQIVYDHLIQVGHNLEITVNKCIIFNKNTCDGKQISKENLQRVETF